MLKNLSVKTLTFASALALSTILGGITPSLAMMGDEENKDDGYNKPRSYPQPPQIHPYNPDEPLTTSTYFPLLKPHIQRNGPLGGLDTLYTKNFLGHTETIAAIQAPAFLGV